ncbi:DUF536 domain-containing protein [Staphylococcus devriesei]|uniref:DUF536 domain-containing protein n=2 Tax=Staphylococcus TaxID=1279 RepID=A0A2T4KTA5_9STAP|nr:MULTISPECIES: DUF536 domain-containing protein [Staphylococcus]RIO92610.1 DUF536 domain-containing protein [Staphylococcus haemolyticus]PTE73240.1 DUF536 domain-containing protein [Staphylococcus devriesei]PTF12563.1 DUF536 domain-containing protein [Staphylococcus devriesei]PTF17960.1 DUF536 domain-containing protein [Staphylococcus devriesei]PTG36080.1 DUF536 domain-containing protein [Staphylococcus capitis]
MKSMKKIADELNVTKMTVYNNAKKADVKFKKIDNVNYLSSEDEIIVVNRIKKNQKKSIEDENENRVERNDSSNEESVKDETIKQLYIQLDIYKEQASRDKEQINTLNRLLENQQVLALESNKKIQRLEAELEEERQLNYSSNKRQDVEVQETVDNTGSIKTESDKQDEKIVSQFSDVGKDTNEDKQQNNDLQHGDQIDDAQKEDIRNENHAKKSFWSRLFGN